MSPSPLAIDPDALAAEALNLLSERKILVLPVVDEDRRVVGIIHLQDLLRLGAA
jgi:arabinose-5-phosphate isomerase